MKARPQVKSLWVVGEACVPGRSQFAEVPDLWVAKMRLFPAAGWQQEKLTYNFVIFLSKRDCYAGGVISAQGGQGQSNIWK